MEPSVELKELTLQVFEALGKSDHAFFERAVSQGPDTLAIGTDPGEWWAGGTTFTTVLKAQLEEMGGFALTANAPEAYCDGNVGWAADQPRIQLPDGAEIPIRLTLVFHKENDVWNIVQWHASVGVTNEELLNKTLTTQ